MTKYAADYCPACGTQNVQVMRDGRLRPVCPQCDHVTYFDPKVAAIAFITQGERVLLVQRGIDPGMGKWALAGGYIELGEHPQDAAIREAREETGLEVRIDGLLDVFHKGSDGGVITIAYAASVTGGALIPGDDAAHVQWFTRDDVPLDDLVFISTITLVDRWLKG